MIGAHCINFKAFRFCKGKNCLVNHYEHRDIMSKWTTLEIPLELFLRRTHLAVGSGLGSVHNTEPG